jgi:hypothetical protein
MYSISICYRYSIQQKLRNEVKRAPKVLPAGIGSCSSKNPDNPPRANRGRNNLDSNPKMRRPGVELTPGAFTIFI